VVADSGPLFLSGDLQIEGLAMHDAKTVRRIAGFGPGTPLTEAMLLDFQDRLRQSSLFDGISVTFDPDPAQAAAVPIRVRLTESVRQIWTFGVGVSANTGPRASVEHIDRRPFGWAAIARNKVEWGRLRQAWDGELSSHPLAKQYRNLVGGAIERLESDSDVVLAQRLRVGRARNTTRVDRLLFVEAEHSARTNLSPTSTQVKSSASALSANYHGIWRRVDSTLLPTRGFTIALQGGAGVARGTPGDQGFFSRVYGRLTAYRPIGENWYGQARIELGQVFRPDGVPVPDSVQFRAGGDDSVRGYAYRSLGPVIDGAVTSADALFTASVELARPIVKDLPDLWGAVFVDAGRAAPRFSDLKPAVGLGVGLRYRSPVGPLRLDLAWGEEVKKVRLHFSVGIAF
jgi:translocation and assembly module TamA